MSNKVSNRKQRRATAKAGVTAKDLREITEHSVATGMEEGKRIAVDIAVENYSIAVAWVLYEKLNYGEKKIQLTMRQIQEVFRELAEGTKDIDDMKKELAEKVNIGFV